MTRDARLETRTPGARDFARSRLASRVSRLVCSIACLAACTPTNAPRRVEFLAMGTTVAIEVAGVDERTALDAIANARRDVLFLGGEWYPWSNNGELVRVNSAFAAGESIDITPALAKLVALSQTAYRQCDGAFDPAVGRLVELWGFHRGERDTHQPFPTRATLDAWRRDRPTLDALVLDGMRVHSKRKDLLLDFGAIGKGYVVDLAIDGLRRYGVQHALIDAGGNLRVLGAPGASASAQSWRVAIRHPRANAPLAWLDLQNEAVATSGDYERFALVEGDRLHHILDPRTGEPVRHTSSVTVVAESAATADVAATAIFVAGPDRWLDIARRMHVSQVMRIDTSGAIEVTNPLAARLTPASAPGSMSEPLQTEWRRVAL